MPHTLSISMLERVRQAWQAGKPNLTDQYRNSHVIFFNSSVWAIPLPESDSQRADDLLSRYQEVSCLDHFARRPVGVVQGENLVASFLHPIRGNTRRVVGPRGLLSRNFAFNGQCNLKTSFSLRPYRPVDGEELPQSDNTIR